MDDGIFVEDAHKLTPSEKRAAHNAAIEKDFSRADINKDGKLSPDEFPNRLINTYNNFKAFFDHQVDTTGDGFVTIEEIDAQKKKEELRYRQEQWNTTFGAFDENKDGALQMKELLHTTVLQALGIGANSSYIMQRYDMNKNGQIDINEVSVREWIKAPFYEKTAKEETDNFTLYDKNHDKKLSFQEFSVSRYQNCSCSDEYTFAQFDKNSDKFVSRKEYEEKLEASVEDVALNNVNIYDTNSDSLLQKNETEKLVKAYRAPKNVTFNFKQFDIDDNGGLNATELVALTDNVQMDDMKYGGADIISPPPVPPPMPMP